MQSDSKKHAISRRAAILGSIGAVVGAGLPAVAAAPLYTHEQLSGLDDLFNMTDEDEQKFRAEMWKLVDRIYGREEGRVGLSKLFYLPKPVAPATPRP